MLYLCTKDLFGKTDHGQVQCFTKDNTYESIAIEGYETIGLIFINDLGDEHEVTDQPGTGSWLKYFVLPDREQFADDILASIAEEELIEA